MTRRVETTAKERTRRRAQCWRRTEESAAKK